MGRGVPDRTILHLTAPAPVGGLESVVVALARGQLTRGDRVTVGAVVEPASSTRLPFLTELDRLKVPVVPIEVPARHYRRERAEVERLIRSVGPSVLHTHGYRTDVLDASVARRLSVPVVSTVHGFTRTGLRGRFYEWLQVRSLRRMDAVVAVSRPLRDELLARGVPEPILHLLPNAWIPDPGGRSATEARERLSVAPEAFHVGWVGRLNHEKAPDVLIEALGRLHDVPWVASFIGDGPAQAAAARRCTELGIDDRVMWQGRIPGAGSLMSAFDLFVLSSRTEGTPIVLLEAMAAGVPTVATSVGGVPDLVGDSAELVASERPDELADGIRRLYEDPDRRLRLGRAARERLSVQTNESEWLAAYEAVYEAAVTRRR